MPFCHVVPTFIQTIISLSILVIPWFRMTSPRSLGVCTQKGSQEAPNKLGD